MYELIDSLIEDDKSYERIGQGKEQRSVKKDSFVYMLIYFKTFFLNVLLFSCIFFLKNTLNIQFSDSFLLNKLVAFSI